MSTVNITPPPLSSQSVTDLLCTIMVLCQGKNDDGSPFWAYMCIKPSMAKTFRDAREKNDRSFKIEEYGTVIESGNGAEVPESIRKRMEREYGVDHGYEDKLIEIIEKLKEESVF